MTDDIRPDLADECDAPQKSEGPAHEAAHDEKILDACQVTGGDGRHDEVATIETADDAGAASDTPVAANELEKVGGGGSFFEYLFGIRPGRT